MRRSGAIIKREDKAGNTVDLFPSPAAALPPATWQDPEVTVTVTREEFVSISRWRDSNGDKKVVDIRTVAPVRARARAPVPRDEFVGHGRREWR